MQLLGLAAGGMLPVSLIHAARAEDDAPVKSQPFSQEALRETAQRLAQEPGVALSDARPPWLAALDYDDYQALNHFRAIRSLWAGGELPFQARFFHLGLYFHYPVGAFTKSSMAWPGPSNFSRTCSTTIHG